MPELTFLSEVLIFLVAAVVVAPIFHRLRWGLVLGYLVAGILIGPHGLGLIGESEVTHGLGELGVTFLLFTIGLELSTDRLRVIRAFIFGLGTAQVAVTGAVIGLIAALAGASTEAAIIIGAGLALSSTAVVLQLLAERGELAGRTGRITLAILLLQDLAVVPFLALVPALAGGEGTAASIAWTLLRALLVVGGIFAAGRLVLRPLFHVIAVGRSPELFAAVTLLTLLGMAWLTGLLGLSHAMGGFLAGLLLAETEYRHQVAAEIAPFRGVLMGLFFMTVGMGFDIGAALGHAGAVAAVVALLVVVKAAILAPLCRVFGNGWDASVNIALVLAQGGEFAFILFGLAAGAAIIDPVTANVLVAAVAITMALTAGLAAVGKIAANRIGGAAAGGLAALSAESHDLRDHVVIAGYGRVGQAIAQTLAAADIPYIALDLDPVRVGRARRQGLPVFFGDASRAEVLRAVGADRARAAVVTLDKVEAVERAVILLHQQCPSVAIFVRARDSEQGDRLTRAGASGVVHETFEMSLQLAGTVLRRLGVADDDIQSIIADHRADDYVLLARPIEREAGPIKKDVGGTAD